MYGSRDLPSQFFARGEACSIPSKPSLALGRHCPPLMRCQYSCSAVLRCVVLQVLSLQPQGCCLNNAHVPDASKCDGFQSLEDFWQAYHEREVRTGYIRWPRCHMLLVLSITCPPRHWRSCAVPDFGRRWKWVMCASRTTGGIPGPEQGGRSCGIRPS